MECMDFGDFCVAFGAWALENKMTAISVYELKNNKGWIFSAKPLVGGDITYYQTLPEEFVPIALDKETFLTKKRGK